MTSKFAAFSAVDHHAEIPDNFVHLREVIADIAEDLRYAGPNNFIGSTVPGYEASRVIVTLEAALALKQAQCELSYSGLALKVFDGYRPQRAVDFFGRWAADSADTLMQQRFYPRVAKQDLFTLGYLVKQSSHSRGSTLDLTLIDACRYEEADERMMDYLLKAEGDFLKNLSPFARQSDT